MFSKANKLVISGYVAPTRRPGTQQLE